MIRGWAKKQMSVEKVTVGADSEPRAQPTVRQLGRPPGDHARDGGHRNQVTETWWREA